MVVTEYPAYVPRGSERFKGRRRLTLAGRNGTEHRLSTRRSGKERRVQDRACPRASPASLSQFPHEQARESRPPHAP